MRTNLRVPFAEKDKAKRLGARWDPARKLWYVDNAADLASFARWLPTQPGGSPVAAAPPPSAAAQTPQAAGVTIVGSAFVEQPRVCDCPPWDLCNKCQAFAVSR